MYELIDVVDYDVTRLLKLRNIDTGIIEECFDDSAVVSDNNFDFMQIGQQYYSCRFVIIKYSPLASMILRKVFPAAIWSRSVPCFKGMAA